MDPIPSPPATIEMAVDSLATLNEQLAASPPDTQPQQQRERAESDAAPKGQHDFLRTGTGRGGEITAFESRKRGSTDAVEQLERDQQVRTATSSPKQEWAQSRGVWQKVRTPPGSPWHVDAEEGCAASTREARLQPLRQTPRPVYELSTE